MRVKLVEEMTKKQTIAEILKIFNGFPYYETTFICIPRNIALCTNNDLVFYEWMLFKQQYYANSLHYITCAGLNTGR